MDFATRYDEISNLLPRIKDLYNYIRNCEDDPYYLAQELADLGEIAQQLVESWGGPSEG